MKDTTTAPPEYRKGRPRLKHKDEPILTPPPPAEGDPPNGEAPPPEPDDLTLAFDSQNDAEVFQFLESLGLKGGHVTIWRKGPSEDKFSWASKMAFEDFRSNGIESIKRKFGGGEYQVQFRRANGKVVRAINISIDSRFQGELDIRPPAGFIPSGNGAGGLQEAVAKLVDKIGYHPPNNPSEVMAQCLAMMQQSTQQMMQVVTAAVQRPPGNWEKMVPVLTALAPVFVEMVRPRGGHGVRDTLDLLRAAREMSDGRDEVGDDPLNALLKNLGPLIAPMLLSRQVTPPALAFPAPGPVHTQIQPPQPPGRTLDVPPQPTLPPEPARPFHMEQPPARDTLHSVTDMNLLKPIIAAKAQQLLPLLALAAENGSSPESYFEVVADLAETLPPMAMKAAVELLAAPDWQQQMFGLGTLPHPEWFGELRRLLLDEFVKDKAPESAAATPVVDVTPAAG